MSGDGAAMLLRDARAGEELAVARVHVRSWQAGYRGIFPDDFLDALTPDERVGRYALGAAGPGAPRTLLAFEDGAGEPAGFATLGACRDPDLAGAGELMALYVDPDRWGSGVGEALLARVLTVFRAEGRRLGALWVLRENERAIRFYTARGWRADGAERREDPWGIEAHVIRFTLAL